MTHPFPEPLTFDKLRVVNVDRCESAYGEHNLFNWTPFEWAASMAGEIGEAINIAKKMKRSLPSDPPIGELIAGFADELADVIIYADLAAARCGIDLGGAIRRKFNKTSVKIGSEHRL